VAESNPSVLHLQASTGSIHRPAFELGEYGDGERGSGAGRQRTRRHRASCQGNESSAGYRPGRSSMWLLGRSWHTHSTPSDPGTSRGYATRGCGFALVPAHDGVATKLATPWTGGRTLFFSLCHSPNLEGKCVQCMGMLVGRSLVISWEGASRWQIWSFHFARRPRQNEPATFAFACQHVLGYIYCSVLPHPGIICALRVRFSCTRDTRCRWKDKAARAAHLFCFVFEVFLLRLVVCFGRVLW